MCRCLSIFLLFSLIVLPWSSAQAVDITSGLINKKKNKIKIHGEPVYEGQKVTWYRLPAEAGWAKCIRPDQVLELMVNVPESKEPHQGAIFLDVMGVMGSSTDESKISLELVDRLGKTLTKLEKSYNLGGIPENYLAKVKVLKVPKGNGYAALDENLYTHWGTGHKRAKSPEAPFNFDLDLGSICEFKGFAIKPGMHRYTEGLPDTWGFYTSEDAKEWKLVAEGKYQYTEAEKRKGAWRPFREITFGRDVKSRYVRLQTRSLLFYNQVNIGEFKLLWSKPQKKPKEQIFRIVFPVTPKILKELSKKPAKICLKVTGKKPLIFSTLRFEHIPVKTTRKMQSKPNGGNGPDRVNIGMAGFEALTRHNEILFPVIQVVDKTPAKNAGLKPGDAIYKVDGKHLEPSDCRAGWGWFETGPEAVFGRACIKALKKSKKTLKLEVIREGEIKTINLDLGFWKLPTYKNSFPFKGLLAEKFKEDLLRWVLSHQRKGGFWAGQKTICTSLALLGLLGTQDSKHKKAIQDAVNWLLKNQSPTPYGLGFWMQGFAGIALSEYYLASGDKRVLPWIKRSLTWLPSTSQTSVWNTLALGHGPNGLPYGNKALLAPMSHLLVFEALARKCGVEVLDEDGKIAGTWEQMMPYWIQTWADPSKGGNGTMGYNPSLKDGSQFWCRTGLSACAATLHKDKLHMVKAMTKFMGEQHPYMRNSHAYGAPGNVMGLLGLSLADRKIFDKVIEQWAWSFMGAWQPGYACRWSMPHMGAPYMGEEPLLNAMYLALLAAGNKGLVLTGSQKINWLKIATVKTEELFISRDDMGRVQLECSKGPIYYTTDGSVPTKKSSCYRKPFSHEKAVFVTARFINSAKEGKVTRKALLAKKNKWRVIGANGFSDENIARQRAAMILDGDSRSAWVPDRTKKYPYYAEIDFGQKIYVSDWLLMGGPKGLHFWVSQDGKNWGQPIHTAQDDKSLKTVKFDKMIFSRYVKIEVQEQEKRMKFSVLRPQQALPLIKRDEKGMMTLKSEVGGQIYFTEDGSVPNLSSLEYKKPIQKTQGLIAARIYVNGNWLPVKFEYFKKISP